MRARGQPRAPVPEDTLPTMSVRPRPILLLTRPALQSARFAQQVSARVPGFGLVIAPVIEIAPRMLGCRPDDYAGLIFTSENAVATFAAAWPGRGHPVWCVGARTAEAARTAGFARVSSAADGGGDAEALLRLLQTEQPEAPLLHLRGAHARGDLAPRLTAAGLPCDAWILYDQVARPLTPEARTALAGPVPVVLPLFSPRSATLCADGASDARAPLFPAAISPAAARAWQSLRPEPPVVADRPDSAAMLDAVSGIVEGIAG